MDNPFISVIIPVYNVEHYVGDCLRSVMAQSLAKEGIPIECVIVDDRGNDNSMEEVELTLKDYKGPVEFRIITRKKNGGLSAARNSGIREARGRYVFLLDSDDLITDNCLSMFYSKVLDNSEVDVVAGDTKTFPGPEKVIKVRESCPLLPNPCDDIDIIRKYWLEKFPVMAWNKLIRRQFMLNNKLFFREGLIHEDNHWQANSYGSVSKIAYLDEITYLYRKRTGSIVSHPDAEKRRMTAMNEIVFEMGQKDSLDWDQPWIEWFAGICYGIRKYVDATEEMKKKFKILLSEFIPNNKEVKLRYKIGFRYLLFPRVLVRWNILKMILGI